MLPKKANGSSHVLQDGTRGFRSLRLKRPPKYSLEDVGRNRDLRSSGAMPRHMVPACPRCAAARANKQGWIDLGTVSKPCRRHCRPKQHRATLSILSGELAKPFKVYVLSLSQERREGIDRPKLTSFVSLAQEELPEAPEPPLLPAVMLHLTLGLPRSRGEVKTSLGRVTLPHEGSGDLPSSL